MRHWRYPQRSSNGYQSGTVAGKPRHLIGKNDADLAEGDAGDHVLEARAVYDCGSALAKIGVNHLDAGLVPAQIHGALAQRVLHPQAFLIGQHLMWTGLPNIDQSLATQMMSLHEIRCHGSPLEKPLNPDCPRLGIYRRNLEVRKAFKARHPGSDLFGEPNQVPNAIDGEFARRGHEPSRERNLSLKPVFATSGRRCDRRCKIGHASQQTLSPRPRRNCAGKADGSDR